MNSAENTLASDPCISSVATAIMITTSNSSLKRSRTPNQFLGVLLHTIAISGLSRVRTELHPLLIIPSLAHLSPLRIGCSAPISRPRTRRKFVFPMKRFHHGLFVDSQNCAIRHCSCSAFAESLARKRTFTEKDLLYSFRLELYAPTPRLLPKRCGSMVEMADLATDENEMNPRIKHFNQPSQCCGLPIASTKSRRNSADRAPSTTR
jgi:hypothetical protein